MKRKESIKEGKINVDAFKKNWLADAKMAMQKLEEYNKSNEERKGAKVFYVQGFALFAVSERKATKKLRSIMGRYVSAPDVTLDELRDTMIGINNQSMPNGDKEMTL